jgi:hypothetical protein
LPRCVKDLCFEDTDEFMELRTFARCSRDQSLDQKQEQMSKYQEKISQNQAVVRGLDWGRFAEVI